MINTIKDKRIENGRHQEERFKQLNNESGEEGEKSDLKKSHYGVERYL